MCIYIHIYTHKHTHTQYILYRTCSRRKASFDFTSCSRIFSRSWTRPCTSVSSPEMIAALCVLCVFASESSLFVSLSSLRKNLLRIHRAFSRIQWTLFVSCRTLSRAVSDWWFLQNAAALCVLNTCVYSHVSRVQRRFAFVEHVCILTNSHSSTTPIDFIGLFSNSYAIWYSSVTRTL